MKTTITDRKIVKERGHLVGVTLPRLRRDAPKRIRDALGLLPGTKVDISPYGVGAQIVPAGRTARLVEEDGVLVAVGETPVDDDVLFALIDAGRT